MLQDLRVAWRFLIKARGSTALAVLTVGITVALCTIALGALDENLWRPLAFQRGRQLVTVYNHRAAAPEFQTLSYPDYSALSTRVQDGLELAAFVRIFHTISAGDVPSRVQGELVSGGYFDVLGVKPFIGRLIARDDNRIPSGHPVIVLGHELWRRSYGSNPAAVGRPVRLNRRDYTVIGVAPPGFHGPAYRSEFWIPLMMAREAFGGLDVLSRPDVPFLQTVGRPAGHWGLARLQSMVGTSSTSVSADGWQLTVLPAVTLRFWPAYRATVGRFLGIFAALGACVLVVGCANLAGLLLSRSGERQHDLAVRQALGATRAQVLRRLLAESVILTALGGAIGLWLALRLASLVGRVALPVPVHVDLTPDLRLILISIAVSLAACLLLTLVLAVKGRGVDIRALLASSATSVTPRAGAQRALVVAQVAVSCACMTAAGLLLRTAIAVDRIDVGLDAGRTVMGLIALNDQGYTPATGTAFFERLQQDLESQPQVEAVALEWHPALGAIRAATRATVTGRGPIDTRYNVVGPGYFRAMRIPLRAGREFTASDRSTSEAVAIVNETLAARIGPDVIGRTVKLAGERAPRRIVGVVGDVKYNGVTEAAQPFVYLPLAQAFRPEVWVHVRTPAGGTEALVRARLRQLDPDVSLSDVHTFADQLDAARATPRIAARLSGAMALLAVFLTLVGVYGMLAASVAQRRRELSIRAALGAAPADIVRHVAVDGIRLIVIGLAAGSAISLSAGGLLGALLYGVQPRDPVVLALVPFVILVVSLPAWLMPARRAARTSLVEALKNP